MNMNDRIVVTCGIANHAIFVTNLSNLMAQPVNVTKSAIEAVRDYMVADFPKGEESVGYQWTRGDGRKVKLVCYVEG